MNTFERLYETHDSEGAFSRAISLRTSSLEQADAAAFTHPEGKEEDSPAEGQIDPGQAVRALVRELQIQRTYGITTPSHLFSLLHRHLSVTRGAVIVPSNEDEYVPLATSGLDRTSRLRLRFTSKEAVELSPAPRVEIIDAHGCEILASRLSKSDHRKTTHVVVFPFWHYKRLLATLLVFDPPRFSHPVLDVILGALSDSAGRLMFDERQRPLDHRAQSVVLRPSQVGDTITRLRESAPDKEITFIEMELTPLIDEVIKSHSHLDRDRLLDDLIDTVGMLVGDLYNTVQVGRGRVLMVGHKAPTHDTRLLAHIVGLSLGSLFGLSSMQEISSIERSENELDLS